MNASWGADLARWREAAHAHLHRQELPQAERAFNEILDRAPDDLEALKFLAGCHLSRGELAQALVHLQATAKLEDSNASTLQLLGTVQLDLADFAAAADNLHRALQIEPSMFQARLRLGLALEQLGRSREATMAYFTAVRTAQARGRWLNDESTAPGLRDAVKHAMRYAIAGRKELFQQTLEPLRQRYGAAELHRVDRCLDIYLGLQPAGISDPRQKPKFLYFPDIPSQPYYPRERFPWYEALESATEDVCKELRAVLAGEPSLEAFLGKTSEADTQDLLRASGAKPAAWEAYFFYRHGERYDEHCLRCPRTSSLLDKLPLSRIREHAPEALFSVLQPGTQILPHTGVTNTRLVTHLPLIVPSDCALRVGGEVHPWQKGRCVTFDDTFEHEAWNRSEHTRVVLILDCWNPDLTEVERAAVTDLVVAIGEFNRECEPAST
jgi:aspartate beta-hydroxylase